MAGHRVAYLRSRTLNKIELTQIEQLLLDKQQLLMAVDRTADDASQTVHLDQARVGRLSRMDALQAQAMSVETRRRRELELEKIAAALKRIKDGDYGYCISCGDAIDIRRLGIDPAAALCIACADNHPDNRKVR